jgi:hypothetical protein
MRKVLIAGVFLFTIANRPLTEADIGPAPAFSDAVAITEQAVRERLIHPDSAQFEWPYDLTPGSLKAHSGPRHVGWITCGLVNSRDRTGTFTGRTYFEVVIHNGAIEMVDLGTTEFFGTDIVGTSCERLIQENFLRPRHTAASSP